MKIAVLSGKGGTGKTLVSVNMAAVATTAVYVDCDVEEPNGHLFFKPETIWDKATTVKIPRVYPKLCNGCRKCVEFCKFNALAYIKNSVMVFPEVCHSCGGCLLVCPEKALGEEDKVIGKIQKGVAGAVEVYTGTLHPGEVSGVPIIKELLEINRSREDEVMMIDCPPGSACIVMESIKDADYCILVAEPTLFGVHNLRMVFELVRVFQKPFGVILNKSLEGENPAEKFCLEHQIKILGRIPFDVELGRMNAGGQIAVYQNDRYKAMFSDLLQTVMREVAHETVAGPQR